jgi:hypothetical protein
LALEGLPSYLREKLEGHEFSDVSQVLQRVVAHENHARDTRTHGRYGESRKEKEKSSVSALDENVSSDEDMEVCVMEWVDMPKGKPVTCPFLKPSPGKQEEMKFTFDVTKCDKLFDILLQNNIIRLKGGHEGTGRWHRPQEYLGGTRGRGTGQWTQAANRKLGMVVRLRSTAACVSMRICQARRKPIRAMP